MQVLTESDIYSLTRSLQVGISRKGKLLNHFTADQMLLNDAFQHFWRAGVIPNRLRINHRNGTLQAHPQAIGFRAIDYRLGPNQIQFFESPL